MLGRPNRNRITERREATRQEILEAAWSLAGEVGLASLTLRDIANRVGMQPPSLYSHFESKNAIYDAMFGQAWSDYEAAQASAIENLPTHPRTAVRQMARHFYDFATSDLARHQLMNQRTLPGFEPSQESYAPAVRVLDQGVETLTRLGVTDRDHFDIWVSLLGGLVDQQLANDPGGDRFSRLLDPAIDMWADAAGIPHESASNGHAGRKR
jgi:AcrR family transcriptional regulator